MTLLQRLALTTVFISAPLMATLHFLQEYGHDRANEEVTSQWVLLHMQSARHQCEAAPLTWHEELQVGLRPMALSLYSYDAAGKSQNVAAPKLNEELSQAVRAEKSFATSKPTQGLEDCPLQILLRMPWTGGPCAYVLACRSMMHPWPGPHRPFFPWPFLLAPAVIALASLLLAMGPVVRRIRQLTREVVQVAETHYREGAISVNGADEVGALARAFDAASKELRGYMDRQESREKRLRDFLENTTHDVMIPLTVLQGHLADMQSGKTDQAVVVSACNEAHYIASLLHNLSVAAKLEGGEPDPVQGAVDLNALLTRVVARHRPVAKKLGVHIDFAVPEAVLWAQGDVTLLEQAVSNVLHNAIRYNKSGGHVALILEPLVDGGTHITVDDDGPGIASGDIFTLVQRYARSNDARTRQPKGQGLGLNIAYRVCQMHGWKMHLAPSEFGGLRVEFVVAGSTPPQTKGT